MRLHANARLGPRGRQVMVERVLAGWPARQAAEAAGVSAQTCRKWVARYRREGAPGLHDRPSVAHRIPARTRPERVQAIYALRRVRFSGPQIAEVLGMPRSTVSAERTAALGGFLIRYNHHRPHSALGHRPPAARLAELRNNAPGPYS